jgi:hypothetical protein
MIVLILFLIILLIIFVYNNSKNNKIENYVPHDYSSAIDIRLCKQESFDDNILIPEYDREFNLNQLQEINNCNYNENENKNKNDNIIKIKTYIEDPYYHTYNIEQMDNYELTKSDYSIINNIKLKKNQAFVQKNYSLNIE